MTTTEFDVIPMTHQDGLNISDHLNRMANILSGKIDWEDGIFGFIEHGDILDPATRIEYVGVNKDFHPIQIDKTTGEYNLNEWVSYPFLVENKPWMVNADGTGDYQLNESDYTKKLNGSASDVANTSYAGAGAFSWARKIYKHEHSIGNDRYVYFSFTKKPGYYANGFKVGDEERPGAWIPMFYGTAVDGKMKSFAAGYPDGGKTTAQQWTAISAIGDNARFFGGALVETLIDLMIMFAKTTDLQSAYGTGNMSGYDATDEQHHGTLENAVVGGGQFYGTSTGTALNKVFHSLVLATQNVYLRDPYEIIVNGHVKVSKYYEYDLSGAAYLDTGVRIPNDGSAASDGWKYPSVYKAVPEWGGVPIVPGSGSTALGGCDGVYESANQATITAVSRRFGACAYGAYGGPRARAWSNAAGSADWNYGCAPVLFHPVSA